MVIIDELIDVIWQMLIIWLNGQEVQRVLIFDLVFDVLVLIVYCLIFIELVFGDVIVMGMIGGVGVYCMLLLWMKGGDIVEIEIFGIGIFSNFVKDEKFVVVMCVV